MAPTANKPAPSQSASRPMKARAPVVPVIPLPIAQKQQQQRQLKQQKQEELEEEKKAKEQAELEKKKKKEEQAAELEKKKKLDDERQKLKEKENAPPTPLTDDPATSPKPPSDIPSSPPAATDSTPRTAHNTATTASSPASKTPQSPTAPASAAHVAAAAATAAPVALVASPPGTTGRQTPATGHKVFSGPPAHSLHAPLLPGLPTNGNVQAEFVFPVHSRSGSAARHRGPSARHPVNAPPPTFHQAHVSNNSIAFGFQPSNNPSPAPVGHGPLPPPPGLLAGPPYAPYNVPTMGPGDWSGPPVVAPGGDMNGFTPTTAGFNSSNPGSFRGSHSPDHAVDGAAFGHQAGPFPISGPNGTMPPRHDSIPAIMSPHFIYHPGIPGGGGPPERQGAPGGAPGGGSPVRVVDFQLIQHLQQQVRHSLDNPQTADTHIVLHIPRDPLGLASRNAQADPRNNDQSKVLLGHRVVLSQSYTIAQFLRNDPGTMHPGPYNQPIFSYHLKIDDPFLTSEAAMQALRSLYGMPIETLSGADQPMIGAAMDKALANLAAGFLFMLENVKAVGAEQASQLISWETVERVFAFCLNGASFPNLPDNPSPDPYEQPFLRADFRYGNGTSPMIRRLLHAAMDFVIRNFPREFQLNVGGHVDSALPRFSRFPVDIPHKADFHANAVAGFVAGHGGHGGADAAHSRSNGSVSMPFRSSAASSAGHAGVRSPQLMFGDFAPRDDAVQSFAKAKANGVVAVAVAAHVTALSQILVNLPFGYLKHMLEHPALGLDAANANSQDPITVEQRRAIFSSVTEERERRRYEALNSIRAGLVIDNAEQRDAVLSRVQAPSPPQHRDHPFAVDAWDVLGWKEYSYGDVPTLARVWTQSETSR